MPWSKFHREQLLQGVARTWPRATRFIYMELCLAAREHGRIENGDAFIPLAQGGTLVQAVHDLLGGSVQEISAALVKLASCDPPWIAEAPGEARRELRLCSYLAWQKVDDSRARVQRHRQQKRELGNGVTRYPSVTGDDVTPPEREGERDPSGGSEAPGVTRYMDPEPDGSAPRSAEPDDLQGDGADENEEPGSGQEGASWRLEPPPSGKGTASPAFREAWRVFKVERAHFYPGVYQRSAADGPAMKAIAKAASENAARYAAEAGRADDLDALVTFWLERFFRRYLRMNGRNNELRVMGHPVRCAQREINGCDYPTEWKRATNPTAPARAALLLTPANRNDSFASPAELAAELRRARAKGSGS